MKGESGVRRLFSAPLLTTLSSLLSSHVLSLTWKRDSYRIGEFPKEEVRARAVVWDWNQDGRMAAWHAGYVHRQMERVFCKYQSHHF